MTISVKYDGVDITQLVKSVTWSGHSDKPNRQLDLSLQNTTDGKSKVINIVNGKFVEFRSEGVLLFRGVVFQTQISLNGDMSVTTYDENYYLTKSNDQRTFKKVKASDIVKRLCSDFGIPTGKIADTGYVIPKLIMDDKTLYETMKLALTQTKKQTGKRFFIFNRGGKLYLEKLASTFSKYIIEVGSNLTSASYSTSIEDMKTQVKVIGGKKDIYVVKIKDGTLAGKYGIMQLVDKMDEKATKSQVEQRARTLLKQNAVIDDKATIESIGIDDVITGVQVYVREPLTGIVGTYYITADTHTYENGNHTMSLELSHTYDLPEEA